jgi:lauroyl/myristoyl acyltransferase
MTVSSLQLRRQFTELAVSSAIAATARLSIERQRQTIQSLMTLAGEIPLLRRRVHTNMSLALGPDVPPHAHRLYFERVGWFLANALSVFHHGVDASQVLNEIGLGASIAVLDDAVAEGRGVVVVSPHWCGHELVAAQVNRRHPVALLVRQAANAERMARKLKWYDALGVEIVLRHRASSLKGAVTYLNVLKRGKVLALTPDLLTEAPQGIETQIFGRRARLYGGAFTLAIASGAPMIRVYFRWQHDSGVVAEWERVPDPPAGCDRTAVTRAALQSWCDWFEQELRRNPENWLFWLDKRWSRFLRAKSG